MGEKCVAVNVPLVSLIVLFWIVLYSDCLNFSMNSLSSEKSLMHNIFKSFLFIHVLWLCHCRTLLFLFCCIFTALVFTDSVKFCHILLEAAKHWFCRLSWAALLVQCYSMFYSGCHSALAATTACERMWNQSKVTGWKRGAVQVIWKRNYEFDQFLKPQ